MIHYTVKKLADMAGVSVRTLHLYDRMGLLKPGIRTAAGYRMYGEKELLRLQQILFYRELDIPLQEIRQILDQPGFDTVSALESHRSALKARLDRIMILMDTINKTIFNLKEGKMLQHEELYEGLPKEKAEAYRREAIEKWGEEAVEKSEYQLKNMTREELNELKESFMAVNHQLAAMKDQDPESPAVQELVRKHYGYIARFWGTAPSAKAYAGLGDLYMQDERYTRNDADTPDPAYAGFMRTAMAYFAANELN